MEQAGRERVPGGQVNPLEEIDHAYDIDVVIAEDIATLTNPDADSCLFIARTDSGIVGCAFLRRRAETIAEVEYLLEERGEIAVLPDVRKTAPTTWIARAR